MKLTSTDENVKPTVDCVCINIEWTIKLNVARDRRSRKKEEDEEEEDDITSVQW